MHPGQRGNSIELNSVGGGSAGGGGGIMVVKMMKLSLTLLLNSSSCLVLTMLEYRLVLNSFLLFSQDFRCFPDLI